MKKNFYITAFIITTIILLISCESLELYTMTPQELKNKVDNFEYNINKYNSYDSILQEYILVQKITRHNEEMKQKFNTIANNKLERIAIEKNSPFYIDVDSNEINIYDKTLNQIKAKAINEKDISILLNWLDKYRIYSEDQLNYSNKQSQELTEVYEVAEQIEQNILNKATEKNDKSLIEKYFETKPYDKLHQDYTNGDINKNWNESKDLLLKQYDNKLLYEAEKAIYEKAIEDKNPAIYTSKYPNGEFDVSKIPNDIEGRDYKTALTSIEKAEQFLEDYPNSTYTKNVQTYIVRQEWFNSDTYINVLKNVPEKIQNSQIMIRPGIIEVGSTFKELFMNQAPLMKCNFTINNNLIKVKLESIEKPKYTMTYNFTYSAEYGGMVYLESVIYKQGLFNTTTYSTYAEKKDAIIGLLYIFV